MYPDAQFVQPVYPEPPHWKYWPTVQVEVVVAAVDVWVVVVTVDVVAVVLVVIVVKVVA